MTTKKWVRWASGQCPEGIGCRTPRDPGRQKVATTHTQHTHTTSKEASLDSEGEEEAD